jgi:hypothetical protein
MLFYLNTLCIMRLGKTEKNDSITILSSMKPSMTILRRMTLSIKALSRMTLRKTIFCTMKPSITVDTQHKGYIASLNKRFVLLR